MRTFLYLSAAFALLAGTTPVAAQQGKVSATVRMVDYQRDIQPMLARTCYGCHGPSKFSGNLRVDSVPAMLKGGRSGPAIVPGKGTDSLLVKKSDENDPTPHKGQVLNAAQIVLLKAWIDQGALGSAPSKPAIVEVDLNKLPPELAREIMEALQKTQAAPPK
jgi:hypothetical protein